MRQQRIEYELKLFRQIDETLLEQLASLFEPDYLVRWLCSPHEALWWSRPIEYIASHPSTFADELLQIARDDAGRDRT